jgi:hypothetical protein
MLAGFILLAAKFTVDTRLHMIVDPVSCLTESFVLLFITLLLKLPIGRNSKQNTLDFLQDQAVEFAGR